MPGIPGAPGVAEKSAAPAVVVKTVPTKTVVNSAKATVTPSYSKIAGVSKVVARLSVKSGSRTVVSSKPSAKLAAGTYKLTTKVSYRYKGKKRSVSKAQTLKITKKPAPKPKPRSVAPSGWDCPKGYPVKGNASSMIYHVPGGAYYTRTNPEECFATTAAARAAGYRASMR